MSAVLAAFVVSVAAGGFGSLVGIGGGLIVVPVLSIGLGYDLKTAIAASLIGVIGTSIAASPRYIGSGLADRRLAMVLLVGATAGGLTGGLTAGFLDAQLLALLFGALLVAVAIRMARSSEPGGTPIARGDQEPRGGLTSEYVEPTTGVRVTYTARRLAPGTAVSFVAGNVSGLLGVGGGIINVPTMNVLMDVPIRVATTTSTYMLAATACASSLIYLVSGQLEPLLAAPVALGVIVGARGGARLSMHIPQEALRIVFVIVSLVFAAGMFGRGLDL